ncbi:hypothetical protein NDU88_006454 [Pleurodeles waltl]|uniref:Uncharacterized protein n=1 Tax=Pleurodeles waltl TaxID=8319 RepID=A0AAV7QK36_PLEWA|nr:hypothetical protein NDU88_006454 [Pleurodeles waltl]
MGIAGQRNRGIFGRHLRAEGSSRDDKGSTVTMKKQASGKASTGPELDADLKELQRAHELLAKQRKAQGQAEKSNSGSRRAMKRAA